MAAASPRRLISQVHCLVLVLDDHDDTREMYATFLTHDGHFTVESNVAPTEAFDWVRTSQPDVVVTDYRMPGLDGLEFCQQLAEHPDTRDVPRIMLTGITSEAELAPLRHLCAAVLIKPVFPADLIVEIYRVTDYECGPSSAVRS